MTINLANAPWASDVVRRAHRLAEEATALAVEPTAETLAINLERGLLAAQSQLDIARPLIVTLLGGTGVGKSTLFNALLHRPELSPTSVARCFTRRPQIACTPSSHGLLTHFNDLGVDWHEVTDASMAGVVLVDTPDIDGMLPENWAVTRAMLEQSDVVVFVTDPDRRANMDPLKEAARWAPLKTWAFVLTKADHIPAEERSDIRADWLKNLNTIGLDVTPQAVHHLSLKKDQSDGREDPAIEHLRRQIFGVSQEEHRSIRLQNIVSLFRYAVAEEAVGPLAETGKLLEGWSAEKSLEVRELYRSVLADEEVRSNLAVYIQKRTWSVLAEEFPGPIRVALWVRARFEQLSQSYAIVRLTRGGLAGLLLTAGVNAVAALRTLAPLERILALQGERLRTKLASIEGDLRRRLEDRGLDSLFVVEPLVAPIPLPKETEDAHDSKENQGISVRMGPMQWSTPSLDQMVESVKKWTSGLASSSDPELLVTLRDEVELIVRRNAGLVRTRPMIIIANVGPLVVLIDIIARILHAWWWSHTYHAISFYGMAAGMLAVSCLPGYWILSRAIARKSRQTQDADIAVLASAFDGSPATRRVGDLASRFEQLFQQATQFRRRLDPISKKLAEDAERRTFISPAPKGLAGLK